MKRTSTLLCAVIAGLAVASAALMAGCSSVGPPTDAQVQAVQTACAIDAGMRPSVTVLLAVPNLATPQEVAAVMAARAVIDPICANPGASIQSNAISALTAAATQVASIATQLQARRQASP